MQADAWVSRWRCCLSFGVLLEAVEPMLAQAVNGQLRIAEAPEADAPELALVEGGLAAAAAVGASASASGEAMVELS